MKKISFAVIFSLLLILLLIPSAFAEGIMIYDAPNAISAGEQLNHLVATVPAGSLVEGGSIDGSTESDWISIESSSVDDANENLYIKGSTLRAGSYTYFINVQSPDGASNTISCTVSVVPATPQVSMNSSPIECYAGDSVQLSVSASVNDGGSLSYQWYSNTVNSSSGGVPVEGGNSGSLTISASAEGSSYYYCEVTNTNNSMTAVSVSAACPVVVKGAEIVSISVVQLPDIANYEIGESLNPAGLQISLNFSDGSSRVVAEGFSLSPMELTQPGVQLIEINYQGKTCTFSVNVEEEDEVIEGIGVLTMPAKTQYLRGDILDPTGLSIRVYTNKGQRDVQASELQLSPTELSIAGSQTITVSYGGQTCTFNVEVKAEEKPVSLSVLSKPQKLNYTLGETLDTSGLTLRQTMSSGEKKTISQGFSCEPTVFDKVGPQTITVTYGDFSCSFNVNVTEKKAEVSPNPSPDTGSKPQASPEPSPHISEHEPHKTGSHTALIVIMVVAILALIAVGAYAVILNQRGEDNFIERIKEFFNNIKKDR